jgi:hypothetical protein
MSLVFSRILGCHISCALHPYDLHNNRKNARKDVRLQVYLNFSSNNEYMSVEKP